MDNDRMDLGHYLNERPIIKKLLDTIKEAHERQMMADLFISPYSCVATEPVEISLDIMQKAVEALNEAPVTYYLQSKAVPEHLILLTDPDKMPMKVNGRPARLIYVHPSNTETIQYLKDSGIQNYERAGLEHIYGSMD